jgi:hypothetical protein
VLVAKGVRVAMLVWPYTPGSPSSSSASSKRGCGVLGAAHSSSAPTSWAARRSPEKEEDRLKKMGGGVELQVPKREASSLGATALPREPCKGVAQLATGRCGVMKGVPVWVLTISGDQLSLLLSETKYREKRKTYRKRRAPFLSPPIAVAECARKIWTAVI